MKNSSSSFPIINSNKKEIIMKNLSLLMISFTSSSAFLHTYIYIYNTGYESKRRYKRTIHWTLCVCLSVWYVYFRLSIVRKGIGSIHHLTINNNSTKSKTHQRNKCGSQNKQYPIVSINFGFSFLPSSHPSATQKDDIFVSLWCVSNYNVIVIRLIWNSHWGVDDIQLQNMNKQQLSAFVTNNEWDGI